MSARPPLFPTYHMLYVFNSIHNYLYLKKSSYGKSTLFYNLWQNAQSILSNMRALIDEEYKIYSKGKSFIFKPIKNQDNSYSYQFGKLESGDADKGSQQSIQNRKEFLEDLINGLIFSVKSITNYTEEELDKLREDLRNLLWHEDYDMYNRNLSSFYDFINTMLPNPVKLLDPGKTAHKLLQHIIHSTTGTAESKALSESESEKFVLDAQKQLALAEKEIEKLKQNHTLRARVVEEYTREQELRSKLILPEDDERKKVSDKPTDKGDEKSDSPPPPSPSSPSGRRKSKP